MQRFCLVLIGAVSLTVINTSSSYAQKELRVSDLRYGQSGAKDLQPVLAQNKIAPLLESQPRLAPRIIKKLQAEETFAREGVYGSVSGNARFLNATTLRPIRLGFDTGYGVNAALGYRFRNNLRLEAEFSYGSNKIRELSLLTIATLKATGTITTLSGLLNLYYDIPTNSRFEPYIGAGIGASRLAFENLGFIFPGTNISSGGFTDSTTVLVYQLRAGVAYNIDSKTAITLGYRYFNVTSQSVSGLEFDGIGFHNIELGLRYWF